MMFAAKKRLTRDRRKQEGFSFLELVIVVAVIGVLAAIAVPSYGGIQSAAKQAAVDATAENGLRSATAFGVNGSGATGPQSLDETLKALTGDVIDARYLDTGGAIVSNPTGDLCVWAYNFAPAERNADGTAKYQAFEGNCPDFTSGNYPTVPGDSGNGGGESDGEGSGGNNPGGGTGSGGGNDGTPGDDNGSEPVHYSNTRFVLQCDTALPQVYAPVGLGDGELVVKSLDTGDTAFSTSAQTLATIPAGTFSVGERYELVYTGKWGMTLTGFMSQEYKDCFREMTSWETDAGTTVANFEGMRNLIRVPASIPTTLENTLQMFKGATSFNQNISSWDMSNITMTDYMFQGATSFNQPIGSWDMSNVESMSYMFNGAEAFNQELNAWDTSKVTTLQGAFSEAKAFNRSLNNWDTGNVTTLQVAFAHASSFNGALDSWDTSKVTNLHGAFAYTEAFNQSLDSWDVRSVRDFSRMFMDAKAFNQSLNSWELDSAQTLEGMFANATNFAGNVQAWDVSKVTRMASMFYMASSFNVNLSLWNVSSVIDTWGSQDGWYRGSRLTSNQIPAFPSS